MGIHIQRNDILTGTGSPIGKIVPEFVGQEYIDIVARTYYTAYGTNNNESWIALATETGRFDISDGLTKLKINNPENVLTLRSNDSIDIELDDVSDTITFNGPNMDLYLTVEEMESIKGDLEAEIEESNINIEGLLNDSVYSGRMNGFNLELLTKDNRVKSSFPLKIAPSSIGFNKFISTGVEGELNTDLSNTLELETKRGITTQLDPGSNKIVITGPDLSDYVTSDMIGDINGNISNIKVDAVYSGRLSSNNLELLNKSGEVKSTIDFSKFNNQNAISKLIVDDSEITSNETSSSIKFISGKGIELSADDSNKELTISSSLEFNGYVAATVEW